MKNFYVQFNKINLEYNKTFCTFLIQIFWNGGKGWKNWSSKKIGLGMRLHHNRSEGHGKDDWLIFLIVWRHACFRDWHEHHFDTGCQIWCQFHQCFTISFYASRSRKHKNSFKLSVSFCNFGIFGRKSWALNVDEIAPFHQRSTYSFYARRSQMHKKDSQVSIVILRFWAPRA